MRAGRVPKITGHGLEIYLSLEIRLSIASAMVVKRFFIFLLLSSTAHAVSAQFPHPDTLYMKIFGGTNMENFREVINVSSDSGYLAIGTTSSFSGIGSDFYLVRTDYRGNTLWSRSIGDVSVNNGYSVQEAFDGGFILGGFSNTGILGDYDFRVVKTDTAGFVEWSQKYGTNDWDFLYSVRRCPDSCYVLCGETYGIPAMNRQVYLMKIDRFGNKLWEKNYGGPANDCGNKVFVAPDSGFVIAGYTESYGNGMKDGYLIRTDSDGDTLFTRTFGGIKDDEFHDVIIHSIDSGFVVSGYTCSFSPEADKDSYVIKTNKQGGQLWYHQYGESLGEDDCYSTLELNNGWLWFNNSTSYGAGKLDIGEMVANDTGKILWDTCTINFGASEDDIPYSSVVTLRNDLLVCGTTSSFGYTQGNAFLVLMDTVRSIPQQFLYRTLSSDSLVTVDEVSPLADVLVFPNPSRGWAYLSVPRSGKYEVDICTLQGEVVFSREYAVSGRSSVMLELGDLTDGIYILRLRSSGYTVGRKLLIQK